LGYYLPVPKGEGAKRFKGKYVLYELSLNFQWDGEFIPKAYNLITLYPYLLCKG